MAYEDAELLADCANAVLARYDADSWRHATDEHWHYVEPAAHRPRDQGWKLHLPATPLSACLVLSRATAVLAPARCAFKFARSMAELHRLIEPNTDRAAAGKFITVYPDSDEQAVALAGQLHDVTLGLPGQIILSDRRYRADSQVFYRYGAFVPITALSDDGEYVTLLRDDTGALVRDQRAVGRPVPTWITQDPFQTEPPAPQRVPDSVLVGDRYRVHKAIRQSNRGGVYVATDVETGDEVILKRFRPHTVATANGTDARRLADTEARMLGVLGPVGASPEVIASFTHQNDRFVAQELVDGVVLRRYVSRGVRPNAAGTPMLATELVLDLARQLTELLAKVHEAGYVLGDLTPNNIMVTKDSRLVLIDLESALRAGEFGGRMRTMGYVAPEDLGLNRHVLPAPEVMSDLYGLGATLFFVASGGHPPLATGSRVCDLVRLSAADNPAVAALWPVLTGLLADDPQQRPSLDGVREALRTPCTEPVPDAPQASAEKLIADMLAELAHAMSPDTPELWPAGEHSRRHDPCSVQTGAAGPLLVLIQALAAGHPVESTVDIAAHWLAKRLLDEPRVLPGLMFGRAGTALALVAAGRALHDDALIASGTRLASRLPTDGPVPDVWHGVAGAGMALLSLWRDTGEDEFLTRAVACGQSLRCKRDVDGDLVTWTATGDSTFAGTRYWGFAHGVAGIGTFLLDLAVATGDDQCHEIAAQCAQTLAHIADRDGSSAYWPSGEPDENADSVRLTGLCSGSSGVGGFLLRYHAVTGDSDAADLAVAAARAVRGVNWTSPPAWCHGLASNGDFLLDCAEVFGERRYRDWAHDAATALAARTVSRGGQLLSTDDAGEVTAAFGNGFSGPLSFLLRLRHGGRRPLVGEPRGEQG